MEREPVDIESPIIDHTINEDGIEEIHRFLKNRYKEGAQGFSSDMLAAWAEKAEFQLGEGNPPIIELKSFESVSGHTETYKISDEGVDVTYQWEQDAVDFLSANTVKKMTDASKDHEIHFHCETFGQPWQVIFKNIGWEDGQVIESSDWGDTKAALRQTIKEQAAFQPLLDQSEAFQFWNVDNCINSLLDSFVENYFDKNHRNEIFRNALDANGLLFDDEDDDNDLSM